MKTKLTVLLAEDNEDDVFLVERALKTAKITDPLHIVADGHEAVRYLRGGNGFRDRKKHPMPDVCITDLKMPGKTGFELVDWVRRESHCRSLPVVILTSSDEPRDIMKAYELGANAYLTKGGSVHRLSEALKDLYEFWKQTAELPTHGT